MFTLSTISFLMTVWSYLPYVFDFLFAAHAAALVIVNLTKTPADDAFLAGAYRVLEVMAGLVSPKSKMSSVSGTKVG